MGFGKLINSGITKELSSSLLSGSAAVGSFSTTTIDTVAPQTIFQWDANLAASYSGSGQPLLNVIASPYGGDTQASLDWQLGNTAAATTDDPTFNAGSYPTPSRFTTDGADILSIVASTAFLNTLHRSDTGETFWCVSIFKLGTAGVAMNVCGNANGSTSPGWRTDISSTNILRLIRADGTVNATNQNLHSGLVAGIPYLHVFTYVPSTGVWKSALNSRTFTTTGTNAFPITANATGRFCAFAANNSGTKMNANSDFWGMTLGAGDLTDGQLSTIVDYYNALHGRTYA